MVRETLARMGTGGARLFRWRELWAERDTTQRVWLFIARTYRLTDDSITTPFSCISSVTTGSICSTSMTAANWSTSETTSRTCATNIDWVSRELAIDAAAARDKLSELYALPDRTSIHAR
jgi:hypothetical protein